MAKRSWRNFDFVLFGTLLVLSAYGVTMIYSATINTLGVESSVQRQTIFVITGVALLFFTASVDYRLLEIVQHPFAVLTPLVLTLAGSGLIVTWAAGAMPEGEPTTVASLLVSNLIPILAGFGLIVFVFAVDRVWIEQIDLIQVRVVGAVVAIAAIGAGILILGRGLGASMLRAEAAPTPVVTPYLLVGGLALVYLLDCFTLRVTDMLRNPLYVLVLVLLGITIVLGQAAGGSQRWLGAGKIQPSELAKILMIITLAKFLADREERMEQFSTILLSLVMVIAPMVLIYLQPDLGTALTLIAIWLAMIWMAKVRFRHLLLLVGAGLVALPLAWFALEDYMRQRLLLFVNPASDLDSYFNVYQALVSIGSGGWTGKGLTHGTQNQLHFLRVRHTDFIFAVTAEELGFLGAVVMIGLLFFILWRILRVVSRAQDTLGRLIATGVGALVLFQTGVNVGMNLGLVPVTGIPLPFVSYGGSSFLTLMVGMGLVESVAMRHRKLEFG